MCMVEVEEQCRERSGVVECLNYKVKPSASFKPVRDLMIRLNVHACACNSSA